jgi:hypothetical protein
MIESPGKCGEKLVMEPDCNNTEFHAGKQLLQGWELDGTRDLFE